LNTDSRVAEHRDVRDGAAAQGARPVTDEHGVVGHAADQDHPRVL